MKLSTLSFRGMAPRITPRALPDNASQEAINARLLTGDLEAWKRPALVEALANAGVVRSIFPFDDIWLSYTQEVEFARGAVIDDDADPRVYITGLDAPRFTTYALATQTGSSPPYPAETRLLGVPAPDAEPLVEVTVPPPDESNITLTNPGAEAGNTSGWTIDSGALEALENGDIPGLNAQTGNWFFGGGAAAATEAHQDVNLESLGVIAGQGLLLTWWQANGSDNSLAAMAIEFIDDAAQTLSEVSADQIAVGSVNTWVQRTLSTQVPDGAVTARLKQLYTLVGSSPIDSYIDTIALSSIEYTNSFDGSSLSGWQVSPNEGGVTSTIFRRVEIDNTVGWPAPSIRLRGDSRAPYFYRNFSTDRSPTVTLQFDYLELLGRTNCGLHAVLFGSAGGVGTSVFFSSWVGVRLYTHPSWDQIGASVEQVAPSLPAGIRYTVTLTASQTSETAALVTIRVVNAETGEVVVDDETATISVDGPNIGFKAAVNFEDRRYWIDNISVTVAAPNPNQDDETTYTSYVYTFVNDFGEESAPSPASDTVQRNENATTIVTTPTSLPTGVSEDYGITTKAIYRAVTGALGTVFRFVAEIPLEQAEYEDALEDDQLGDVLESEEWDLPPSDLRYILALPNGIMVGASGNRLCFSVQNRPHAWPVAWRLAIDSDITGLGNVDTSVVVGSETFVYTASGNSPDAYSMSKPVAPHSCQSARSVAFLTGIGVVFAGPDGLMTVSGPNEVRNLTELIFTRDQWQELGPSTMLGIAHDDVYFLFSEPGASVAGSRFAATFDEDGATVDETVPTTAPEGFVWQAGVGGGLEISTLTGAAKLSGVGDAASNYADAFTPFSFEQGMAMRMVANSYADEAAGDATAAFTVESPGGAYTMSIVWNPSRGANELAIVYTDPQGEQTVRFEAPGTFEGEIDITVTMFNDRLVLTGSVTGEVVDGQIVDGQPISLDLSGWDLIDYIEVYAERGTSGFSAGVNAVSIEGVGGEGGTPYGFALDMRPNGFGLIELGMHACAVANDLRDDALALVLDAYEEPEGSLLPPDTAQSVDADGLTIYEWNASETAMRYSWRGKLWLNPYPKCWPWVRVRALDYDDLEIQFYADGTLLHQQLVTSNQAFRLPMISDYNEIEWVAIGTSRVRTVELADDSEELN